MPLLAHVVVIATVVASVGGKVLDLSLTGFGWVVPLVLAGYVLLADREPVRLPVALWFPWVVVVLGWLLASDAPGALQRSVMLVCPLVVGAAVSKCALDEGGLAGFRRLYHWAAVGLFLLVLVKTGLLFTGVVPGTANLAAPVMSGALLSTIFGAAWSLGESGALAWWIGLAAGPIIGLTRMGIIATAISLPLTLAPLRLHLRVAILALLALAGGALFFSERMQHKMFYSGAGSLYDLSLSNPNMATYGRMNIWENMQREIARRPILGHGANQSESFVRFVTGGAIEHPHNDWLRLLFDYGYFGTAVFGLCCALQTGHALWRSRGGRVGSRVLFCAGATSFLIQALFMLTDNVILYAAFFGNLQFTILGLAYASAAPPTPPQPRTAVTETGGR